MLTKKSSKPYVFTAVDWLEANIELLNNGYCPKCNSYYKSYCKYSSGVNMDIGRLARHAREHYMNDALHSAFVDSVWVASLQSDINALVAKMVADIHKCYNELVGRDANVSEICGLVSQALPMTFIRPRVVNKFVAQEEY
jgi:hypothetical protein